MKEFFSSHKNARRSHNEPNTPPSRSEKNKDLQRAIKDQLSNTVLETLREEARQAEAEFEQLDEESRSYVKI
ncbi:hypothetical protein Lbir_2980 [Legionella birminghamensis]|uniref:Uncharacterized protein n=1 Tax=Legionella birminghamensis TaxID=28083 RepID=A0A378I803_9GAMM|nr:hypothetical protein [Legionella birminghamensis]KTC68378.1 hypothetical protein Lbir_2980 [Legionella birminghamensis]STX30906.1 Uncharacterised protein [Legionella birminghamensis]